MKGASFGAPFFIAFLFFGFVQQNPLRGGRLRDNARASQGRASMLIGE
jgi:hypothetical protein